MTEASSFNPGSAALLIICGASIATLMGAWGFELIGGLPPCPLCLQQRWSYYAAIPVCLLAVFMVKRTTDISWARAALIVCGLMMLAGAGLAAYHAGIEWNWWKGPDTCSSGDTLSDRDSILPDLTTTVVRCDEAAWRLFGLSLAGYNVLISLALAGLSLWGLTRLKPQHAN